MSKTRIAICFMLIVIIVCFCTACACSHNWEAATCEHPKKCSICGVVEGESLSHEWVDATCTSATYCSLCKQTAGNPIGHIWIDATASNPKICAVCNTKEGNSLTKSAVGIYKHSYIEDGYDTYDVLDFKEDGTVFYTSWYRGERASGTFTVGGTWKQNGNTIDFTLQDEWFEDYNLNFTGGKCECTITDEGILYGYDIYKKIS